MVQRIGTTASARGRKSGRVPDLDDVRAAHARLLALVGALTDGEARRPSLLPGWTIGHVLTHLARNADSFTWLAEGAEAGEVRVQYPGGPEQRTADIEAGAGRPAAELVEDLRSACARLEAALAAATAWDAPVRTTAAEVPLHELPFRRLREVEIHTSDLDLGHTWHDWSDAYVEAELAGLGPLGRRHVVAFLAGRADQPRGLFG